VRLEQVAPSSPGSETRRRIIIANDPSPSRRPSLDRPDASPVEPYENRWGDDLLSVATSGLRPSRRGYEWLGVGVSFRRWLARVMGSGMAEDGECNPQGRGAQRCDGPQEMAIVHFAHARMIFLTLDSHCTALCLSARAPMFRVVPPTTHTWAPNLSAQRRTHLARLQSRHRRRRIAATRRTGKNAA
jgi:hypothetical protein